MNTNELLKSDGVLFFENDNSMYDTMYNTIRLIKETVGVPYEYIENADQCKATTATIYGILLAAEAIEEVLKA